MRALMIEDERQIAEVNKRVLEGEGFAVETAATLSDGQRLALANDYDIIVTDLMLPDGHGLAIVKGVRERGKGTPILVITGVNAVESTVTALDVGADDYLRKPYDIEELRARVRALMRRGQTGISTQLTCGNITMNRIAREATVNGRQLNLTPKEFMLLEFFATNLGKPISRVELLEKVWRIDFHPGTNVVDVNVARLRAKLNALDATCSIDAARGVGYKFTEARKDSK
jgi:two-component system, OmpR family, response regulator